jgi:hypothetical protein
VPISFSGNMNGMDKVDFVPCCNMKVILIIQEFEICFILQFQVSEWFFLFFLFWLNRKIVAFSVVWEGTKF